MKTKRTYEFSDTKKWICSDLYNHNLEKTDNCMIKNPSKWRMVILYESNFIYAHENIFNIEKEL